MSDRPAPETPTAAMVVEETRRIDLCMMVTHGAYGWLESRPMSNNRQVDDDGRTWLFTRTDSTKVRDVERDHMVTLDYTGDGLWISVQGTATLHTDRELMAEHWTPDIEEYFGHGMDEGDLRLVEVAPARARVFGRAEGVVELD